MILGVLILGLFYHAYLYKESNFVDNNVSLRSRKVHTLQWNNPMITNHQFNPKKFHWTNILICTMRFVISMFEVSILFKQLWKRFLNMLSIDNNYKTKGRRCNVRVVRKRRQNMNIIRQIRSKKVLNSFKIGSSCKEGMIRVARLEDEGANIMNTF